MKDTMLDNGFRFRIDLFGEGDGGAAAGGEAGGQGQATVAGNEAQAQGGDEAEQARRAAFDKALTDNKDLYEERLKAQLDRRMKASARENETLKGQNARFAGLAQAIADRYGLSADDMDGLEKAVREDQSWLEEQAARNGLTVEQQKHMNALEAENQRFKAAREAAERQRAADQTLSQWRAEADELAKVYPGFDLESEVNGNASFADLLGKGVNMRTAYEVVHHDELVSGAMQYAVNRTANAVAASVRANGLRATEGAGSGQAAAMQTDVSKLTRAQMRELERRAKAGERITLRE